MSWPNLTWLVPMYAFECFKIAWLCSILSWKYCNVSICFYIEISLQGTNTYFPYEQNFWYSFQNKALGFKKEKWIFAYSCSNTSDTEDHRPMTYQKPSFSPSFKWQVPPCLHGLLMHAWIGTSQSCPWTRNGQVECK